jgi:carboxymethylenebutenolidase
MGEATPLSAPPSIVYPESQIVSPQITLQAPLSRHGKGPGLILVVNHAAEIEKSDQHLDPPPLQKWAEEGFAVVQLVVPGKVEDGGEFPVKRALELLKNCEGCEFDKGVGLICKLLDFVKGIPSIGKVRLSTHVRLERAWDKSLNYESSEGVNHYSVLMRS